MNYKIIENMEALQAFVEWLPDLNNNETFYVCLFARKKYSPEVKIKSDKSQLRRFTSNKARLIEKIHQLEVPVGSYTQGGTPIPQEALVVYITPNPRCLIKATRAGLKMLVDRITGPYDGYNPHQDILSAIQQSASRKLWIDFDFDGRPSHRVLGDIVRGNVVNIDAITIVDTRGGCHVLVRADTIQETYSRTWYNAMMSIQGVDVRGDNMIPIPGCVQGGFIPKMVSYGKLLSEIDI